MAAMANAIAREKGEVMARLHKEFKPLNDTKTRELEQDLKNLQGNILSGHGRNHAVYIFLTFKRGENGEFGAVKEWIREMADRITSAYKQRREAKEKRKGDIQGDLFCSFFLSAAGYKFLDYFKHLPDDISFRKGLWKRWEELCKDVNKDGISLTSDKIYRDWEYNDKSDYKNKKYQNMHAMLMLASDDKESLDKEGKKFFKQLEYRNIIDAANSFFEEGRIERFGSDEKEGKTYEHFGFRDNISQPLFFEKDIEKYKTKISETMHKWDPSAGPNLVLVEDCNTLNNEGHAHGSYFVFLKLEQDVEKFNEYNKNDEDKAHLMGRYPIGSRDGEPFLSPEKKIKLGKSLNDFNYFRELRERAQSHRQLQEAIPSLSSHIRRMNSRGEQAASQRERPTYELGRRIARRGMPYEESSKKGLLFMCYQAGIGKQFEYLLRSAHRPDYINEDYIKSNFKNPEGGPQRDALIGRLLEVSDENHQYQGHPYPRFVTLKGGEYFFAPSIPFLRNLP